MLLRDWRAGNGSAANELLALVYDELHRIASAHINRERQGHALSPTELVSEAYLRLSGGEQPEWADRVHFFAIAARTMRQVLVDHARARDTDKRGGGAQPITLDEDLVALERPHDVIALDDALSALAKFDARKAQAIELRYFGGMTHDEIAEVLDVHANTIAKDLQLGEAWIRRHLAS
jgi:RNA polymerase sigma factor (TIGR02999 family)